MTESFCQFGLLQNSNMSVAELIEDPVYVVFIVLEIWAFISSVVGNSLVLYVMTREKKLRRQSNYHIISVAVSNLLFGAIGIPFTVYAVRMQL